MAIIKLDGGYNALPISYKRGNPIPLDTTAVWYDFAALETYAQSGVTAYVGQVLTYVDSTNNTATAYVIADTAGTLEPIGTAPVGDSKSIVVDEETGTVSLKGISALVFTREVDVLDDDGQPTGEKTTENIQYQPLMTKDGLIWVEPSKTTVEGLASLIDGLTARVSALENDRVTEAELAEAIKDFATDSELSEAIKDFVTDSELSEAIKDFATDSELSEAIKDFVTDSELSTAISGVEAKIPTNVSALTNDAGYLVANDIAGKADKSDTYTKAEVDDAIDDAVKGLLGENVADAYDTLKEIQDLLEGTDGEAIDGLIEIADANKVAIEVLNGDVNTAGSVDKKIADAVAPLATTAALNDVKATAEAAATKVYVDEELGKKVDASTYATDKATFALAENVEEALGEVNEALALKANAADVVSNDTFAQFQANNTQAIAAAVSAHDTTVQNTYATKTDFVEFESEVATDYAKKADVYTTKQIDDMIAGINQGNQESAAAVNTKLTNYITSNDKEIENLKAVDTAYDVRITEAKGQADKGVNDAAAAQLTANEGKALALENQTKVNDIDATVKNHTSTLTTYGTDIAGLKAHDETHTAQYNALNALVGEHGTAIAGKAEKTDLAALDARVVTNTTNITTLNDVTIPEINRVVGLKANAADVYTTGAADEKFLAKADYKAYDDTSIKALITAEETRAKAEEERIASLVATEAERAAQAEKANADAIAIINGSDAGKSMRTIAGEEALKIVDGAPEAYNTLKEVADWIANDQSGAAAMAADINENKNTIAAIYTPASGEGDDYVAASGILVTEIARVEGKADANDLAIKAINNTDTGILAVAKKYTDDNMVQADGVSIDNTNGKFSVKKVSVDVLDTTGIELILYGGNSGYVASVDPEASE